MRSALYYPHTELRHWSGSEPLLKQSLLLWDELEFIVPYPEYRAEYADRLTSEAIELIGRNHYPTEDEKHQAHQEIEDLVTRPQLPEAFFYKFYMTVPEDIYEIYPEKFLPDTWEMLQNTGLAGELLPNSDFPLQPVAGLSIMSILADACAGATRARITDRPGAYASIGSMLGNNDGVVGDAKINESRDRAVAFTLKLLNLEKVSLASLIELRKRELKESGHSLRDLRHRYVERIEAHLRNISDPRFSTSDVATLERQFESDMRDDLAQLKTELRMEFEQAIWSKDMVVSLIAGAGTLASLAFGPLAIAGVVTAAGAPATIGGLLASRSKFLKSRSELMRKHPLSYLYEASGQMRL